MSKYKLLFSNKDFIAINKLEAHSFHSENGEGLVSIVKEEFSDIYPIHRLDKLTTGLLLFARSKEIAQDLSKKFENREIQKIYIALSNKKPKKKQGLIKGDMDKSRDGTYKLSLTHKNPALTQFFSFALSSIEEGLRLFVLKPSTGKTHQLRVALKSLGSAIIGDARYKGLKNEQMHLHAYQLAFELKGEKYSFKAELPNSSLYNKLKESEVFFEKDFFSLSWPKIKN